MTRDVASANQAGSIVALLHDGSRRGTLGFEQLSHAVRFVYDDGDDYSHSVGASWIWNNPDDFAKCVGNEAEEFFRQHMDVQNMASASIVHSKLLALVPPEHRIAYVRETVSRYGFFDGWVPAACECGIPRQESASIIRSQIERNPTHKADYFLRYGSGRLVRGTESYVLPDDAPWAMFDNDELVEVINECVPHAPQAALQCRKEMLARFSPEVVNLICATAAHRLKSVIGFQFWQLDELPLDTRLLIAKAIDPLEGHSNGLQVSAMLICSVLIDLQEDLRPEVVYESENLLDKIPIAPVLYAAARNVQRRVPRWLEEKLTERLIRDGYVLGTLEYGEYKPKGASKPQLQAQLKIGEKIFVQEKRQRGYYPTEGEKVIVCPRNAKHLASRKDGMQVWAAYFIPATTLK